MFPSRGAEKAEFRGSRPAAQHIATPQSSEHREQRPKFRSRRISVFFTFCNTAAPSAACLRAMGVGTRCTSRIGGALWAEWGVLAAVFERWRDRGLVDSGTEIAMLDSTSVKVHTDRTGGLKKRSAKYRPLARRADDQASSTGVGRSSGVEFFTVRRAAHRHDAPKGRQLLQQKRSKAPEVPDYGPCLRRRTNAAGGARLGSHARGAAPNDTPETLVAHLH